MTLNEPILRLSYPSRPSACRRVAHAPVTLSASTPGPVVAPNALTCVIVEDQVMFLDLLAVIMILQGGVRVVAQARDVAAGRAVCEQHRPDVLILDLALPDGDGLDVARRFIEVNPRGRALVVSGQASDFVCPPWLDANLQALISKDDALDALRRELYELTGGATQPVEGTPASPPELTQREAEIFGLIGDGLSTRDIAAQLGLSEHTVQTHRKRIATKLRTTGDGLLRRAVAHRATRLGGGSL